MRKSSVHSQTQKDLLVVAVLASQEATPYSVLSEADTSSYASEMTKLLPLSTDEEKPTLEEGVQEEGELQEQKKEEEESVVEGQPQALDVSMFYRKKAEVPKYLSPALAQLTVQVDRDP